jgi:hypothetical protein
MNLQPIIVDCCPTVPPPPEPELGSSCSLPLFVEICNPAPAVDQELLFTDAVPICIDNGDGTFSGGYTREKIVWDSITSVIVSRETEYSVNGSVWTTTAPADFTLGKCPIPDVTKLPAITEAFGNNLSTLTEGHNFAITKPACCKIKVTTSIGAFHVLDGIQFYSTSDFHNTVTIDSVEIVSGNCTLDNVHIISNKLF